MASALDALRERLQRLAVPVSCDLDEAGRFRGDPEALRRVVLNLVGNALDAFEEHRSPDPTLRIEAGENLAGSEVWLRIRDNGPGMEPERAARAFDPFYTSRGAGTGLGLPICKKLVEAHGGRIELDSREGRGTQFLLSFPKDGADARDRLEEEPS